MLKNQRYYHTKRKLGCERRNNQDCKYVRAKRRPNNLPCPFWDDKPSCHQKSWKVRRKTQYYPGGRGTRHELFIGVTSRWDIEWEFRKYCNKHGIPHKVETVRKSYTYLVPVSRKVEVVERIGRSLLTFVRWKETGEYRERVGTKVVGQYLIWWTNKRVDMITALRAAFRRSLPDEIFEQKIA